MAEADAAAAEMAQIYSVPSLLLLPTPPLAGFTHST
jgi:hypothetical protein